MKSKIELLAVTMFVMTFVSCGVKQNTNTTNKNFQNETLELAQTQWQLLKIGPLKPKLTKDNDPLTIVFDKDNLHFAGFAGCNRYFGSYTQKKETLKIGDVAATKMLCPDDDMIIEQKYLPTLDRIDNYVIKQDTLFLRQGERVLLTFLAKG